MTIRVGTSLTIDEVVRVARGAAVEIDSDVAARMGAARAVVEDVVASGDAVYGITTGLGDLANVRIETSEAERLQADIVRSHSTGVGPALPVEVVRAMMLLKARTFAFGISGVRFDLVERLVTMLQAGISPAVPSQGSLGASGDLAQLAHLAQSLIGEGEVVHQGVVVPAADALRATGLEPLHLSHKEGLSLVNGTEMMLAIGILAYDAASKVARAADLTGAMSVEACLGTDRAFDERVVALRSHVGAKLVAANLRSLLAGSEIVASHRESEHLVQDAYSLRCIPQVHGAYRDGLGYVRAMLEAELASAIDNPSVLVDTGEILSGGNFHGESLALAMDHLALCATGFATIAERRVARLVDPDLSNGLPAFLTTDPGRRSGFMLAQYTAAALVSENRSLCFPASVDSIPTSAGQEDHVSMGATAARKAAGIVVNVERVIAIEALAAAQGLDLRSPLKPARGTDAARRAIRAVSGYLDEDRSLAPDIEAVRDLIASGELSATARSATGTLD
ncbi:MAG: histidine ammonia-lyase [Actinomycetota bacterium]|nr:histidine ammonia-lyase [Actinomycetota bacterium]